MSCTCDPCTAEACTASTNALEQAAGIAPADHTKLATDWKKLLEDIVRVNRASTKAVALDQAAYHAFHGQAKVLIDKVNEQPPISPVHLLETLKQLIVIVQGAEVPVSAKDYTVLSRELDTFSVEYLKYLDEKKDDQGVVGKRNRFNAEYSDMRSYIDRLQDNWMTVGEKLSEIQFLLENDIEKCGSPNNYPAIQIDLLDAVSKFMAIHDKLPCGCTGSGYCCYGC